MKAIHEVLRGHPGFLHVAIGQIGVIALGSVFWLVMARILLPDSYGKVNWLISIAMFASTFCVLGWGRTVTTYYPKEGRDELIGGAVVIVLAVSLIIGIVMGALVEPSVGLLIVSLSLFSMVTSSELGRRRYTRYKWICLAPRLISLFLAVAMYFLIGLVGVLLGYAIPYLIFGFMSLRYLHRSNPGVKEARGKAGFALKAFGVDITTRSLGLLDKILIGSVFGMVTLGLYQLAYQISVALSVLPGILFTYLLPEKSAGAKTKQVEALGILASVVLAVLVFVLSPWVIPRLFPNFSESVGLIQIMGLGVIPYTMAVTKMSELYAREKPGAVLISYSSALAVGVIGILVLGTYFGGIGLATSSVLVQTMLAVVLLLLCKRQASL